MMRVRIVIVLGLLAACVGVGDVGAKQAGKITAKVDSVKQGPGAGTLAIQVSWANVTNISGVTVKIDAGDNMGNSESKTIGYVPPPALNPTGAWAFGASGFTSGYTVTKVKVDVYVAGVSVASDTKNNPGVTVP